MPNVYTRYGDKGETGLLYGGRISKDDPRAEAYGAVDEAVSAIGLGRSHSEDERVRDVAMSLQRELFTIGAELATDVGHFETFLKHFSPATQDHVDALETQIDSLQEEFELPRAFVVPGASPASAALDLARSTLRRAERRAVSLARDGYLRDESLIVPYLNRAADLLFILARYQDRRLPTELVTGER